MLTLLGNLGAREEKSLDNRNAAASAHNQRNGNNDSKTNKTTECVRQKSPPVPTQRTIEALERAEGERD